MHIVCPLSGSANLVLRETIEVKALIKLYSRWGGFDISSEFLDLETINFYHCLDSDLKFFSSSGYRFRVILSRITEVQMVLYG